MLLNKEILIGIYDSSSFKSYELWQFASSSGASLTNASVSFNPSAVVQINWGDGSIETLNTDVNYTHTFA